LVELECRAGQLHPARELADTCLAIVDEGVDTQPLGALLYARALVAALQGDTDRARELADRGIRTGEAVRDRIFPMLNRAVLGFLELSLGNTELALSHLQPLPDQYRRLGYGEPGRAPFEPDRIEALIELGRRTEAAAALKQWDALAHRLDRPRVLATGARLRGLITAARGDTGEAVDCLESALRHHDRLPDPHERARTLLIYGATLRRAGRRRHARDALTEARQTFEALGESIWTERATAELKRLGGRTPAGQELTGAEQQVADLVAQGRTNREVADALYITVRTVEANLTRIYSKLGIRSRAQLIALQQSQSDAATARHPANN
jgi:DNA-binding CsgD family transcriptional regulator